MPAIKLVRCSSLVIILFFLESTCIAQLTAGFTVSDPGGCSPLPVTFKNTTSGASSSATYSWDFGNGNSSSLKDPAAVFTDAKMYTVTLTVTDSKTGTGIVQLSYSATRNR